jgi:hypothetical protein
MFPNGAPFKRLFNLDTKYQIGRLQQGLVKGTEEAYATWNDLCEKFSEKSLTKRSDMPIILSDLAKDFENILPGDRYVAGIWQSTLPHSLLWKTRGWKSENLKYMAPSWSWLSTDCAVTLANRFANKRKEPIATILDVSMKLKYQDPYGPVESGALKVESILRHVLISFEYGTNDFNLGVFDDKDDSEAEGNDKAEFDVSNLKVRAESEVGDFRHEANARNQELRLIGSSWDDYHGNLCTLELDAPIVGPIEGLYLDCYCLFLTIRQWGQERLEFHQEIACLLLKPVSGDKNNFTRVGTLLLKDLFALKMRYNIISDLKEDFWKSVQGRIQQLQEQAFREAKEMEMDDEGLSGGESATSDTSRVPTKNTDYNCCRGIDALYQYDNDFIQVDSFQRRLTPQILTIV